jgi:hypothetical protein
VFHDSTPLFLIARPEAGTRIDSFYFYPQSQIPPDCSGSPSPCYTTGPITSIFSTNPSAFEAPRYLNWSLGLEQKLPGQLYLKAEFIQKHGTNGFANNWLNPVSLSVQGACPPQCPFIANFQLENHREDRDQPAPRLRKKPPDHGLVHPLEVAYQSGL